MLARGALPLCLLLLAWTFPTRVSCQNITVEASTHSVEATWVRRHFWYGVEEFEITFSAEGSSVCIMTVPCTTVTCSFSSMRCGLMFPCTPTNITVSGGSYTAPTVSRITSPEPVSAFEIYLDVGVEYISWVNPSMDSSPCYEKTAVRFSYIDEESISYFGHEEETMNKSLCIEGSGEVEVWTEGGGERSNSSWEAFENKDIPHLVVFDKCEPVDCTAIDVEWFYFPLCPDVDHIDVQIGWEIIHAPVTTTNLTVTDLTFDAEYITYVMARRKDGAILDIDSYTYCATRCEVPENLEVEALNSSSLRVTWDPPLCPTEPPVPYLLTAARHEYTTNATTYDVGGLLPFTQYYIEVQMDREEYTYSKYKASMYRTTSAPTPTLSIDNVDSDAIEVSWEPNLNGHYYSEIDYEVTWGKDLQFQEETTDKSFIITDFNSTDEVYEVCVATTLNGREELVSETDCKLVPSAPGDPEDGLGTEAIVGIVVFSVLVVAVLSGLFLYYKKRNSKTRTLQTDTTARNTATAMGTRL